MCDRDDLVTEQRFGRYRRILNRQTDERYIDLAVKDLVNEGLACACTYGEIRIWILFPDRLQDLRQLMCREFGRRRSDPQSAVLGPGKLGDLFERRVVFAEYLPGPVEQALAGLGQYHSPRRSGEERKSHLILELADLHRDRRLRDVDATRTRRKRFSLGDSQKSL